ncbi:hypothetical protein LKL35_36715 [Streptomyces sp. ET3-23]|uniref:hypothetical protein n=1 Tax=Streptomyces sp. ET3-23 TaxID=2885643 RepID=UPI001D1188C9|nr:hypothetical protein [Streptomyces sp. ET3-23]MCC2280869.1 hypothetical protein [Streptomyces sp. ET3-23]
MTRVEYTARYVTQEQLARAYRRLGHASATPAWSATLLIDTGLTMSWACPVLHPPEVREEYPAGHDWHVIAEAGELDWPPLRPEEEIWPALLERQPVPTRERAEAQARFLGKSVEEMHRENLRRRFLGDAHIGTIKRNPSDFSLDPLVRDWDATARELAEFLDTHRPPKLTTEQRVMEQGVRLAELEAEVLATKASLGRLMRNAARDQGERLRKGFKADMHRWGGVSRPTVDAWLSDGGCCEGTVPDEDGTTGPSHSHTTDTQEQAR